MLIFFNFESRRRRNSNESQVKIQEESIQTLSSIHPLSESLSLSFPESNAAPNVYVTFLVSRFSTQSQLCTGGNNIYLAESRSSIVGLTHITWSRDSLRSPARRQLKLGSNNFPSRRGDGCNVLRDVSSSSLERPTENKHERTISKIVLTPLSVSQPSRSISLLSRSTKERNRKMKDSEDVWRGINKRMINSENYLFEEMELVYLGGRKFRNCYRTWNL